MKKDLQDDLSHSIVISEYEKTPTKNEKESIAGNKKKKTSLFSSFFFKSNTEIVEPLERKHSAEHSVKQQLKEVTIESKCKICLKYGSKKKKCQFCKDEVCIQHIRKKRAYKKTHTFARICDNCEDQYLYTKYLKSIEKEQNQLKENEIETQKKLNQIYSQSKQKKQKLTTLISFKNQLEMQLSFINNQFKDLNNNALLLDQQIIKNQQLQTQLNHLDSITPPSLQNQYKFLVQELARLTKQVIKYEKLKHEVYEAKAKKEKKLYQEYYNWEKHQRQKNNLEHKKEDCIIY